MRVGVIGWGSLLWSPRTLAAERPWRRDGPRLPIEFARIAANLRITLVATAGVEPIPTYWVTSRHRTLDDAAENLRVREGPTRREWIHLADRDGHRDMAGGVIHDVAGSAVSEWLATRDDLDGVVWTGIPTTGLDASSVDVLTEQVIAYLRSLKGVAARRAREYIERAPPATDTAVRRAVEHRLGWTRIPLVPGTVAPS